jgi:hypothetical protein
MLCMLMCHHRSRSGRPTDSASHTMHQHAVFDLSVALGVVICCLSALGDVVHIDSLPCAIFDSLDDVFPHIFVLDAPIGAGLSSILDELVAIFVEVDGSIGIVTLGLP